jgi:glycogen(starch) synthase
MGPIESARAQRVLVISNLFPPRVLGGYEIACANICAGLRERGVDVRVMTTPMDLPEPAGTTWVRRILSLRTYYPLPQTSGAVAAYLHFESAVSRFENTKLILDEVRAFRPDAVVLFNVVGIGGIAIMHMLNEAGVPWLLNLGDDVPGALIRGLPGEVLDVFGADPAEFFREIDIVALSERLADEVRESVTAERVSIVPRGVRVSENKRRGYRLDGVTRFVFAGSLYPNKGIGQLLDAAAELRSESSPFTLDVFGGGEVERYRERAESLGLADLVRFHGHIDQNDLASRYVDFDVFLFPSWDREPFGSAPVEAAAMGCVPVISELAGVAEWFLDGGSAILVTPTTDGFVAAMERVLADDFDFERVGGAARRVAAGPLDANRVLDRLEVLISRAAAAGPRSSRLDDPGLGAELLELDRRASELMHAAVLRAERGE